MATVKLRRHVGILSESSRVRAEVVPKELPLAERIGDFGVWLSLWATSSSQLNACERQVQLEYVVEWLPTSQTVGLFAEVYNGPTLCPSESPGRRGPTACALLRLNSGAATV